MALLAASAYQLSGRLVASMACCSNTFVTNLMSPIPGVAEKFDSQL